ncbi:hypothetical protein HDU96_007105 [Phlyctochytrium bullatum]|nr:hypothetical protein HDU96_007105 [Phlyctochytrium bullatum]
MPAVVIDTGSFAIRVGLSDESQPAIIFNTVYGSFTKDGRGAYISQTGRDVYIGQDAIARSGILKQRRPVTGGQFENFEDLAVLWNHAYDRLGVSPTEFSVLLTETDPLPFAYSREMTLQTMFEEFRVPSLCLHSAAALALMSSGRTTGIVLDCGEQVTRAVPVYEGSVIRGATKTTDIGGRDLTLALGSWRFHNRAKELFCRVSPTPLVGPFIPTTTELSHPDPDDPTTTHEILECMITRVPELLFNPDALTTPSSPQPPTAYHPIPTCLRMAIASCDAELQPVMWRNVVLNGGTSLMEGFVERVRGEMGEEAKVVAPPERAVAAWLGGAMMAEMECFGRMCMTRKDYDEWGPGLVHRMFA